jgi:hypothetical protein
MNIIEVDIQTSKELGRFEVVRAAWMMKMFWVVMHV